MKTDAQGTRDPKRQRYQAIPRVLIFLRSRNPQTGEEEVLLLKGAPTKRLWANHYNGLGGHVEAEEDVYVQHCARCRRRLGWRWRSSRCAG